MPPPVLVNGIWLNFVDEELRQSAGMWTTQDQSTLALSPYDDVVLTTIDMSDMGLFGVAFNKRAMLANATASGPYNTYRDQAVMVVQSANARGELVIPGPKEEIFYDSGQLVNLSHPTVQAWWAAVQAVMGDQLGSPWTQLIRGYRRMVGR